ncbi:hypothetical protein [Winogradskyella sp. MIT101101]|uniref:hypothetical protein n=1 Tax=Winogradskyella sp. MIT101101 TaxID=3098297 RepID=UPI00399A53D3
MQNLEVKNSVILIRGTMYLLILALALCLGCSQNTFSSKNELMNFINDESNGYVQYKSINGVDFGLMYRPVDLLIQQEIDKDIKNNNKKNIDSLRNKYSNYLYLNLNISKDNQELLSAIPESISDFSTLSNKLSFEMDESIFLITTRKDTLDMVDYLYPKMYGATRSTSILFVFHRDKEKMDNQNLYFVIKNIELGTGEVKFKLDSEILNYYPRLTFKE